MRLKTQLAFASVCLIAACAGAQDDGRTPATQPRSLSPDPPSATQPDPNVDPPERPPPEPEPIEPATSGMIPMTDGGPGGTGGRGGTGGVGGTGGAGGTGGGKPF